MTNFLKWKSLTSALESPDLFLDLSWYWAVATALERRVFYGDLSRPQFCNMFLLLVGPPAVGKGTAMREATKLLHAFPFVDDKGIGRKDPITLEDEKLFRNLPDTLTFEKLIEIFADKKAPRAIILGPQSAMSYTGLRYWRSFLASRYLVALRRPEGEVARDSL